jgi:hypothetical protein
MVKCVFDVDRKLRGLERQEPSVAHMNSKSVRIGIPEPNKRKTRVLLLNHFHGKKKFGGKLRNLSTREISARRMERLALISGSTAVDLRKLKSVFHISSRTIGETSAVPVVSNTITETGNPEFR